MRIAVVFDTPYDSWHYEDHARQMAKEVAAWKDDEPEMEYQIADALRQRGHDVTLIGVKNDLEYLVRCLDELHPELVFNAAEAFHGNASLEYMVPGLLEAEGYRYTGSPPMALLVSRNKAMSKKVRFLTKGEVSKVTETTSPANVNRAWENWCRMVDRPYRE